MTTDELRAETLKGLDSLMGRPFLWNTLSKDYQRLVKSQRDYWREADQAALQALLSLLAQQP